MPKLGWFIFEESLFLERGFLGFWFFGFLSFGFFWGTVSGVYLYINTPYLLGVPPLSSTTNMYTCSASETTKEPRKTSASSPQPTKLIALTIYPPKKRSALHARLWKPQATNETLATRASQTQSHHALPPNHGRHAVKHLSLRCSTPRKDGE